MVRTAFACVVVLAWACTGEPHATPAMTSGARGIPQLRRTPNTGIRATKATDAARALVAQIAPRWGVSAAALPELRSLGEVAVQGGTIVRLSQVIDGMPVWRDELHVLVRPDGEPAVISGVLHATDAPRQPQSRGLDEHAAIAIASAGAPVGRGRALRRWAANGGVLTAAWIVELYLPTGEALRVVLAEDGHELERTNLVADAAFTYRVFGEPTGERHPLDGPIEDPSPNPAGAPNGMYPASVASTLVTVESLAHPPGGAIDPWLPAGAVETVGNNVDAYVDVFGPDGLTVGDFRAGTTGPRTFDRGYDLIAEPLSSQPQQMASVTSLFYVLNWLHDFWYDAGFTEGAGNAQADNYGRGGSQGDPLLGEAQDGALTGSRNNANMATPSDGMSPRMQVFLWTGNDVRSLVLAPSGATPRVGSASFGARSFDASAPLVLAVDGTGTDASDACSPITNAVAGRAVLVHRGTCSFKSKALAVQTAGGVAMVVTNNAAGDTPPQMGDDGMIPAAVTIGALSVTKAVGDALETELATTAVTAALHRVVGIELDGGLDSTLIAHEYGHYIHHRLSACDNPICRAMSEGWGDFIALMLMSRAGDDFTGAFPIGVYVTRGFSSDAAYFGIRRAPYSTNLAINGLSFRHMGDGAALPTGQPFQTGGSNSEVHNAGEVWAQILWDAYVAILATTPNFEQARARFAGYVVAGLLLTPPEATPTEARDGLLAAIAVASQADHDAVAAAFARRGLGSCAVSPPRDSDTFIGIVESTEVRGRVLAGVPSLDDSVTSCDRDGVLDSGETARITVPVTNHGAATISDVTVELATTAVDVTIPAPMVHLANLGPGETVDAVFELSLAEVRDGPRGAVFTVAIQAPEACGVEAPMPFEVRLASDDVVAASARDDFDAASSVWTVDGAGWSHVRPSALDGVWRGANPAVIAESSLVSPALVAAAETPLTITFTHSYSFEHAPTATFDGGVVEISRDDGATWRDISTVATIPYNGTVGDQGGNPLSARRAFTATNPAYPAPDTVTLDLGTALAGQTFRLRFRIGSDNTVGDRGWELRAIAFTGLVGTPFPTQVTDARTCGAGPQAGGCCDAGSPNAGVWLGVVVLLRRRRR